MPYTGLDLHRGVSYITTMNDKVRSWLCYPNLGVGSLDAPREAEAGKQKLARVDFNGVTKYY